jgi:hypothetical protein
MKAANDFTNSDKLQKSNGLIGFTVQDTLDNVADVLDFLHEFDLRKADSEITEDIICGRLHVTAYARDALRLQVNGLNAEVTPIKPVAANG